MEEPPTASRRSHNAHVRRMDLPLSEYIPVGCLIAKISTTSANARHSSFHELGHGSEDDMLLLQRFSCAKELQELFKITVLRLEACTLPFHNERALRIYVSPRDKTQIMYKQADLQRILSQLDVSSLTWKGCVDKGIAKQRSPQRFDLWATPDDQSLTYMFNTLASPAPVLDNITDYNDRDIAHSTLNGSMPGLRTLLYPYQRRSITAMLEREIGVASIPDPRYEAREGPTGSTYYYDPRTTGLLRKRGVCPSSRGGILAESMGLGKTIICLALILATQHHLPSIPFGSELTSAAKHRGEVRSLAMMSIACARAGCQTSIRGRLLAEYAGDIGNSIYQRHLQMIDDQPFSYTILTSKRQRQIGRKEIPIERRTLCSTTLVVVPSNLIAQWQLEIAKHVEPGRLKILIMTDSNRLPSATEILQQKFDIILFSKETFQKESRDGETADGRRASEIPECRCSYRGATRIVDCRCPKTFYGSPLKKLHFLRIIVDEGQDFACKSSKVDVSIDLVAADRRWIVSGTPAKDKLLDADIELASTVKIDALPVEVFEQDTGGNSEEDGQQLRSAESLRRAELRRKAMKDRRVYNKAIETSGAAIGLGMLAKSFLQMRPWTEEAKWADYIFRHEDVRKHVSFSSCLRPILQSIMIKTRPEDVEKDIILPPMHHKVVVLKPCFIDVLTINMFLMLLMSNIITSEREGVDYMFSLGNESKLNSLITNLRSSAFCWTGISEKDVQDTVDTMIRYREKPRDERECSSADERTLNDLINFGTRALQSETWKALSNTHEVGLQLADWLETDECNWSLLPTGFNSSDRCMTGPTQLLEVQSLVDTQLSIDSNADITGIATAGQIAVFNAIKDRSDEERKHKRHSRNKPSDSTPTSPIKDSNLISGVVRSAFAQDDNNLLNKISTRALQSRPPKPENSSPPTKKTKLSDRSSNATNAARPISASSPSNPLEATQSQSSIPTEKAIPPSVAKSTRLQATTSSKLSYLLSRIYHLHATEKILIFYDNGTLAYYIHQLLDLLHIQSRIYSRGIPNDIRSESLIEFNTDANVRVLLMDIHCGALGLTINAASRVFFINPPFSPEIEAQAIKRCHRIGQTKPVYVETLILQGTIEEAIFLASQSMSREDHGKLKAGKIQNDAGISRILRDAKMVDVDWVDGEGGSRRFAPLEQNLEIQVFGREGRQEFLEAEELATTRLRARKRERSRNLRGNA